MKLSQFRFHLPNDLIAQHPARNRDEAKLMVLDRKSQTIEHKVFTDILDYFDDGDVMILNNTKVFPALLTGEKEKTGAKITVFLLRELNPETRLWDVLVDPARKIRIGNKLYFGDDDSLVAEVIDNTTSRGRTIRFLYDGSYDEFKKNIEAIGRPPLPEEIQRMREIEPDDKERYQTIFAKNIGAVAAPAAGLHFSSEFIKRLELKGVSFAEVTLHAGIGNFRGIEVEDLTKHKTDSEEMLIEEPAVQIVNRGKMKRKMCVQ
jgi:S-adenosylmethionine:tRNA ribosyltransferase-isomerase